MKSNIIVIVLVISTFGLVYGDWANLMSFPGCNTDITPYIIGQYSGVCFWGTEYVCDYENNEILWLKYQDIGCTQPLSKKRLPFHTCTDDFIFNCTAEPIKYPNSAIVVGQSDCGPNATFNSYVAQGLNDCYYFEGSASYYSCNSTTLSAMFYGSGGSGSSFSGSQSGSFSGSYSQSGSLSGSQPGSGQSGSYSQGSQSESLSGYSGSISASYSTGSQSQSHSESESESGSNSFSGSSFSGSQSGSQSGGLISGSSASLNSDICVPNNEIYPAYFPVNECCFPGGPATPQIAYCT
ncbi:hypothetical protein DLAC_04366 [Tieghemostelium lacteum]|uniref:Uncharacterized protein n=1 Tax=Tieghemostelium lacteum TaxID=361077 RepID=A0A151ZJF3_TIELA|nr:hypothetical protein DLAC_04366 [Tieghemostelium lacteum]|eukprot:KYQ94086.1 hypothetical protein DLAC_04366 [Tieghemostelium lacteum]